MARRTDLRAGEKVDFSPYPRAWAEAVVEGLTSHSAILRYEGRLVSVMYNKIRKRGPKSAAARAPLRPKGLDGDLQEAIYEWEGSTSEIDNLGTIAERHYGAKFTPAVHAEVVDNVAVWFEEHAVETKGDEDPGVPATYRGYARDLRKRAKRLRGRPPPRAPRNKPTAGAGRAALRQSIRRDK